MDLYNTTLIEQIDYTGVSDVQYYQNVEQLNLDKNTGSEMEKRTDWMWCVRNSANYGSCIATAEFISQFAFSLTAIIIAKSYSNSCSETGVYVYSAYGERIYWRGHVNKSCKTTAEQSTIEGALEKWLREKNDGEVCAFQCLKGTHGGKYEGYWALGTDYNLVKNTACGSGSGTFASCVEGGKNDVY